MPECMTCFDRSCRLILPAPAILQYVDLQWETFQGMNFRSTAENVLANCSTKVVLPTSLCKTNFTIDSETAELFIKLHFFTLIYYHLVCKFLPPPPCLLLLNIWA